MRVIHIELKEANAFVEYHHRHHKAVTGHRFSLACVEAERLCGVAIVGRPVARNIDQIHTVEVLRLCTDGTPNACSFLYGACRRAAKALGYQRIITYILIDEPGTSLLASGWNFCYVSRGGSWDCKARRRQGGKVPECPKKLYESVLVKTDRTWY